MKISIQIEISPEEVGLANEIVATLRQLTADVTVKQVRADAFMQGGLLLPSAFMHHSGRGGG